MRIPSPEFCAGCKNWLANMQLEAVIKAASQSGEPGKQNAAYAGYLAIDAIQCPTPDGFVPNPCPKETAVAIAQYCLKEAGVVI